MTNAVETILDYRIEAVEACKRAVKAGLWKRDKPLPERVQVMQNLADHLVVVYSVASCHIPNVTVNLFSGIEGLRAAMAGMVAGYSEERNEIRMLKPSLVSLLNVLYNYMARKRGLEIRSPEESFVWSLEMFRQATPKAAARAISMGKVAIPPSMQAAQKKAEEKEKLDAEIGE